MKNFFSLSTLLLITLFIILFNFNIIVTTLSPYPEEYTQYLQNILYTAIWLNIGYLLNLFINNVIWQKIAANDITNEPPRLLVQLSSFFIFLIIVSGILYNIFNYPITTIWAASGALGLVIGFALKNLILDTFSGLAISLEKPFKVGDWINCHTRMGNYIGQVLETNWRATRLKTSSNNIVIIPNSYLTSTLITNFSMPDRESRFDQIIVVDFSVDTKRVLRIIDTALHEAVINNILLTIPKKPKVKVYKITNIGVEYKIKYYIDPVNTSPSKASDACLQYILNHLLQAGISPSYPKQDVFNANMPWRQKGWEHKEDIISLLRKLSLFKMLKDNDLEILASSINMRTLLEGETIVNEGEKGDSMFIIAEGLFEVFVLHDDKQLKVANISPGSFFGEKSLLTGESRSATIKAIKPSIVGEISKNAMKELLESNKMVVDILSGALASRELSNQCTLDDLSSQASSENELELKTTVFMKKIKGFFSLGH